MHRRISVSIVGLFSMVAATIAVVIGSALPASAATFEVGTEAELRDAIASATASVTADVININADISLTTCADEGHLAVIPASGDLDHDSGGDLTINGLGHFIAQTCPGHRVLQHFNSGALTLVGLTVTGGDLVVDDGVAYGGGVYSGGSGPVDVFGSIFTENTVTSGAPSDQPDEGALGGALYADNDVAVADSIFSLNAAIGLDGDDGTEGAVGAPGTGAGGGAIYATGAIDVSTSDLSINAAIGGNGGNGGNGVAGTSGESGGVGGAGGDGRSGGDAGGAAIAHGAVVDSITVTSTVFVGNFIEGGLGGNGGNGGAGGDASAATAGNGGNGGEGGAGGTAVGADVANLEGGGTLVLVDVTSTGARSDGGDSGSGGTGGAGGVAAATGQQAGSGGSGGSGGFAGSGLGVFAAMGDISIDGLDATDAQSTGGIGGPGGAGGIGAAPPTDGTAGDGGTGGEGGEGGGGGGLVLASFIDFAELLVDDLHASDLTFTGGVGGSGGGGGAAAAGSVGDGGVGGEGGPILGALLSTVIAFHNSSLTSVSANAGAGGAGGSGLNGGIGGSGGSMFAVGLMSFGAILTKDGHSAEVINSSFDSIDAAAGAGGAGGATTSDGTGSTGGVGGNLGQPEFVFSGGLLISAPTGAIVESSSATRVTGVSGDGGAGGAGDTVGVGGANGSAELVGVIQSDVILMTNSTVADNTISAGVGGAGSVAGATVPAEGTGLFGFSFIGLTHSTVVGNASESDGVNLLTDELESDGSVVALPGAGQTSCVVGTSTTDTSSAESATSCGFDGTGSLQNQSAGVLALNALTPVGTANTTFGRVPAADSVLVDAIDTPCALTPDEDQRGLARPQPAAGSCDIGAIEVESSVPTAADPTADPEVALKPEGSGKSAHVVTVSATVDDSATPETPITSGTVTLSTDAKSSHVSEVFALDGAFDEAIEDVAATIDTTDMVNGAHTACLTGSDSDGNTSPEVCVTFYVQNGFNGTASRGSASGCPAASFTESGFSDADGSVHKTNIYCLANLWSIVKGFNTTPPTFGPVLPTTRAQVATLLAGVANAAGATLPASPPDAFIDDGASVHHDNINALAAAGVIKGKTATTFDPRGSITRAQFASLSAQLYAFITGRTLNANGGNFFTDDNTSVHQANINGLAANGVVVGKGGGVFAPVDAITRAQIATLLAQLLDMLVDEAEATPPS